MQSARIIIIGAGISGIGCAAKLIESGFNHVTLLEAENRAGGRVHTTPLASNVVDLGAQWCHGEKDNVVYELVRDFNVLDQSKISYPNVNCLSSSGKHPNAEHCSRLLTLCLSILENSEEDLKDFKGSLGNYVVKKYQEALKTPEFADIDSETSYQILDYFHKFENSIEASDQWFDTSGNGYLQYWECEGHMLLNWKDKGYKSVINFITKQNTLDVESKILFNKEVSKVDWSNESKSHVTVNCSDGTSYDAEHVICTVSLGVLKENYRTLFTPQLPKLKTNAIEGLSIGVVDKIFLEFEKPFWNDDWAGFSLLWTLNDSKDIRNTPNAWLEDIFGFYKVDYQPNILCGWISGSSARAMEKLDDATVLEGCMFLFEKFLSKNMAWTKPINMIRSNWYSNKHFRGSYSFRSMSTDLLRTSAKDLAQPLFDCLGKPSLLFAGEATSDHYYSTVHGALSSGMREGKRLADYYSSQSIQQNSVLPTLNVPNEILHYDVIVLGAGISGLGAGEVLKKDEIKFVILEGQSQVGGRINTVHLCNTKDFGKKTKLKVDAGAQWLHGRNNELFNLAEKYHLIRPELSEEAEGDYINENGELFDEFFVKKIDFKIGQILEHCETFVEHKDNENFKFPRSIEEFLNENFKSFVESLESDTEKRQAMQLLDWHRKFQIIDNSCLHFGDVSAKTWGNYSFNGESCQTHINISGGMSSIVEQLNNSLKNFIKLNQNVRTIYWKSEEYPGKSNKITIACDDGTLYTTNNLICTFSLGVLKERHIEMFSPPLPKEHREAIENIGFGTINKIFLHFNEKWWADDWKGLQLIWNEDLNDESEWTKYISGFDVVYPDPPNTLLAWIGGNGALEMEKLSDDKISMECMKLLRKFLRDPKIPDPSSFFCSRWSSNDFIRGAYSFTSRSSDHIRDWEKILAKPITFKSANHKQNTILLAGEACHEFYFSTVHGAFMSGMEQAKQISNLIKLKEFNSKL